MTTDSRQKPLLNCSNQKKRLPIQRSDIRSGQVLFYFNLDSVRHPWQFKILYHSHSISSTYFCNFTELFQEEPSVSHLSQLNICIHPANTDYLLNNLRHWQSIIK